MNHNRNHDLHPNPWPFLLRSWDYPKPWNLMTLLWPSVLEDWMETGWDAFQPTVSFKIWLCPVVLFFFAVYIRVVWSRTLTSKLTFVLRYAKTEPLSEQRSPTWNLISLPSWPSRAAPSVLTLDSCLSLTYKQHQDLSIAMPSSLLLSWYRRHRHHSWSSSPPDRNHYHILHYQHRHR